MKNLLIHNKSILIIGFIILITIITYSNVLKNEFIEFWDDNIHVTNNEDIRVINSQSLENIFSKSYVFMYQPITELSYSIDYSIWDLNPFGYHLTNLLLHLISIVLVYYLLISLGINPLQSGIITILYSTTALATEPVSWISARSTLLSASFIFGGILTYVLYLKKNRNYFLYLTWLLCGFALLSRVTAIVFPFILIAIDIFLKKPWLSIRFQINKVPLFLISIPVVYVGYMFRELNDPSMHASLLAEKFIPRILYYLDHWISVHPLSGLSDWPVWFSLSHLSSLALIVIIYFASKYSALSKNIILFGSLVFLFSLAPYLLFADAKMPVADRYAYIPLFGVYIVVGSALYYMYRGVNRILKVASITLILVLVSLNMYSSVTYSKAWKNDNALWNYSLKIDPNRAYYRTKLGLTYIREGKLDAAEIQLSKAYNLDSLDVFTLFNLAALKHETKKYKHAVKYYSKAIEIEPSSALYHMGRANSYILLKEFENAKSDLDICISIYDKPQANLYYLRGICKIETNESPCTDLKIALNLGMDIAISKYAKYCQ